MTALFADVVGFTTLAERLDPEDVRALLTPFYALIRSVLSRYGGSIEQFSGDGVMALFGAPAAHEDDPERAVRAALAIRDEIQRRNESETRAKLDIRVGVNTGEVLISYDQEGRLVAGDAVNTAQRLQTCAPVNGVLVGADTHRATSRFIEYRELGPIEVKGKVEPVAAWEGLAPFARFGPEVISEAAAPLVGRTVELGLLEGLLRRTCQAGEPQLVTLVGAPGAGKSRLLGEIFLRGMRDTPGLVYWRQGRCLPYGERSAFSALGDMVRAQAGILDSDSAARAEAKLRAALERFGDDTDWLERHLRPLVGLAEERAGDRPGEAFAAWRRFFECLARERPIVLVFEDLQWADDGLLDFVDGLLERAAELPILVVCTARPELLERREGWGGGKRNATTISIGPLAEQEMRELAARLVEAGGLDSEHVEEIVSRAEGNPLYAEEFAQMLRERGAAPDGADEEAPLPQTVQGIIAARIDALPAEEKALLVDAAVVGKLFWEGALAALSSETGAPRTSELLHSLERRELIRRERSSSVAGEAEYGFRHSLVREVAYRLLPRSRRAEKHLLAAAWIELLAHGRDDHAEARAGHYLAALGYDRGAAGKVAPRAVQALRAAGDRATSLASPERAAGYYERALELMPKGDPERPHVLLAHGRAVYRSGGEAEQLFEEARAGLVAAGELEQAGEADVALAFAHFARSRIDESFRCLERSVELLRDAPPSEGKVFVLSTLASFLLLADRRAAALATGEQALAMAEELDDDNLRARSLRIVGAARAASGDTVGLEQLERAIEIARRINSFEAVPALANLAATHISWGDLRRAFALQEQAMALAEHFSDQPTVHWLTAERVAELYWVGRWQEALALSDELLALRQGAYIDATMRVVRARIALARGEHDTAVDEAERALRAARQRKESQFFFPALAVGARVQLESGRDGAEALLDEFLSLLQGDEIDHGHYWADVAAALSGLGRAGDLLEAAARVRAPSRWIEAAEAVARGSFVEAADIYREIGSRPDEAWALLCAAQAPPAGGERAEAHGLRERAAAFFAEVGAAAYAEAARTDGQPV